MAGSDSLKFNRPGLFSPAVIRNITQDTNGVTAFQKLDFSVISASALGNTSSFRYDLSSDGIKSTQQLNVSWSQFESHTFFNSARVKTQVAFDTIINQFPFDGTQEEIEVFLDKLTGFEKYVYDEFPKYKAYQTFEALEYDVANATSIRVKDAAGADFPTISRVLTGESRLNPDLNSMTIEFWIYPTTDAVGDPMPVLMKLSGSSVLDNHGILVEYDPTDPGNELHCFIYSGSYINNRLSTSAAATANAWTHIAFVWDRSPLVNKVLTYVNGEYNNSSNQAEFGRLNIDASDLYIGGGPSGSFAANYSIGFSGSLDELRIWHSVRTKEEIKESMQKAVFANDDLKLYFKFNEPSGSNTTLVIDSSGNSLHGVLSGSTLNLSAIRNTPTGSLAGDVPMAYEKLSISPVLFPDQIDVSTLRASLLAQASEYDQNNPNLITKLIPKHYLLDGQSQDATTTEEGSITDSYTSDGIPKTNKMGDTQLLLSLLWTWAKFFDEMKLYIQAFGDLYHIDYDSADTVPDQFLQFLAGRYGIKLPPLFNGASIAQFINAENLGEDISTGQYSLQYIQNQIWRRILINLRDITTSKGTVHSVKSFIRSIGIDPDNNFRIREFGGPTKKSLSVSRESRTEMSTMIDFISGGFLQSGYLSSSHVEPGYPYSDTIIRNGVNFMPNGLWTSGSFTYEGVYKFEINRSYVASQSLARVHMTGSAFGLQPCVLANLIAYSGSNSMTLFAFPLIDQNHSMSINLTGADIFDGNLWNISFGRYRGDDISNGMSSSVSSSYFLRAAKQNYGEIVEYYTSASFFEDRRGPGSTGNFWGYADDGAYNKSGSFIAIGSQSVDQFNWNGSPEERIRATDFQGKIGQMRFWSKGLSENEWKEHVRNFKSIGVSDPLTHFNFNHSTSGSFERIRMDVSTDQPVTKSDGNGRIYLTDFSQNVIGMSGSNFPATSSVIVPQRFYYSHISPKFDESATNNKIRARSYLNLDNIIDSDLPSNYVNAAPVYELIRSESPTDNTRFTIDFSVVDALNQDIVGIFSTLDALDNIIGNPELVFSMDYPKLEELRTVYFNRLTDKVNLKGFFEFFKWFDSNIGSFITQLIPRKTKYLGTNFVVESHMLERPKMEYYYADIYIGEDHRHSLKDTILLQQFIGMLGRF
jgi:hypothetical protein